MSNFNDNTLQSIHARVEIVNPVLDPTKGDTNELKLRIVYMERIRTIFSDAAKELEKLAHAAHEDKEHKVDIDGGRFIHALDLIQMAKNTAIDGLLLPCAPKLEVKMKE